MRPEYLIQRANPTPSEAAAIHRVERLTLHDSVYSPEEMLDVLRRPEQFTYAARREADMVGFCSCLETPTPHGPRLEIDMLGVLPAHRGEGLAQQLISRAIREAVQRDVRSFRAVVALDNVASQRAFARAGLAAGPLCDLLVYEIVGTSPTPYVPDGWAWRLLTRGDLRVEGTEEPFCAEGPGRFVHAIHDATGRQVALAECQQVQTLAYHGVWLERLWSASEDALPLLLRATIEWAKRLGLDEVGHLAPRGAHDKETHRRLLPFIRQGFRSRGGYLIFSMQLG